MRRHLAFTMTLLGAVTLGALLTVAVAWGCRFVAQFDHETTGAIDLHDVHFPHPAKWSASDAQMSWIASRPGGFERDIGHDGRVFLRAESGQPERTSDGLRWNDFGVDVIAVATPGRSSWTISLLERTRASVRDFLPDPRVWAPPDSVPLPPWSTLAAEPLDDEAAVIEVASGWPWRAFVARHHLPNRPYATHPLVRETTGAWYGTPYGDDTLHQLPYGVIGRGFALNTIVWIAVVPVPFALFMIGAGRIRASARRQRMCCVHCAYRIEPSATDTTCPECGGAARRWRPRFERPARVIWGANLLVAALLLVHAGAILASPEITPFERAAFDGDVATMRTLASAEGFAIPRGPHGGAQPTLIGGRAGRAAALADQHDALRYLLELEGVTPKPPGEPYDRAAFRPILQLLDSTTMWPEIVTTFDLLGDGRFVDDPYLIFIIAARVTASPSGRDLLLALMRDDVGVRQRVWPEAMSAFLHDDLESDARRALRLAPIAPIESWRRGELGSVAIHYAFEERPSEADTTSEARRRELVRDVAHALRAAGDGHADPSRWSLVTAMTLISVVDLESDDAFDDAIRFLATLPPPSRGDFEAEGLLFESIYDDARYADLPRRWRALEPFGVTPNVCTCHVDQESVPLESWSYRDDSAEHVRALLELGAIITDEILENATPENATILRAWIDEIGATIYTHDEVYPVGAGTYAQIPGADDASIRRPPS